MSKTFVLPIPIKGTFGETITVPASNGTKTVFNRRRGFQGIRFEPAADMRLGLVPALQGAVMVDSNNVWIDLLDAKRAAEAGNHPPANTIADRGFTGLSLPLQIADFLYLGWTAKINDFFVNIGSTANATTSTLTMANSDRSVNGFTALSITADGTVSSSATFGQDGNVTFTVPSGLGWTQESLREVLPNAAAPDDILFWLRLDVSAALDAATLVDGIIGFVEDDGEGTATGDQGFYAAGVQYSMSLVDEIGAIQPIAQTTAATTMALTWVRW